MPHDTNGRPTSLDTVRLSVVGPVARLRLHRPQARNAMNGQMLGELESVAGWLRDEDRVRVLVVDGEGPSFCAGADLKERRDADFAPARAMLARRWQRLFADIERLAQTTVASLHGAVVGGGLLLALSCDLRIAADDLSCAMPEVALGGSVSGGGVPRIVREIGMARARDLILTGRRLDAQSALAWSVVTRVVPAAELPGATERLVEQLLTGGPAGLRVSTAALRAVSVQRGDLELGWADAELVALRPRD